MLDKGQFEPRKRTALDGKEWWCVFNLSTMKWSTITLFTKYKTKNACQEAIDRWNKTVDKLMEE